MNPHLAAVAAVEANLAKMLDPWTAPIPNLFCAVVTKGRKPCQGQYKSTDITEYLKGPGTNICFTQHLYFDPLVYPVDSDNPRQSIVRNMMHCSIFKNR